MPAIGQAGSALNSAIMQDADRATKVLPVADPLKTDVRLSLVKTRRYWALTVCSHCRTYTSCRCVFACYGKRAHHREIILLDGEEASQSVAVVSEEQSGVPAVEGRDLGTIEDLDVKVIENGVKVTLSCDKCVGMPLWECMRAGHEQQTAKRVLPDFLHTKSAYRNINSLYEESGHSTSRRALNLDAYIISSFTMSQILYCVVDRMPLSQTNVDGGVGMGPPAPSAAIIGTMICDVKSLGQERWTENLPAKTRRSRHMTAHTECHPVISTSVTLKKAAGFEDGDEGGFSGKVARAATPVLASVGKDVKSRAPAKVAECAASKATSNDETARGIGISENSVPDLAAGASSGRTIALDGTMFAVPPYVSAPTTAKGYNGFKLALSWGSGKFQVNGANAPASRVRRVMPGFGGLTVENLARTIAFRDAVWWKKTRAIHPLIAAKIVEDCASTVGSLKADDPIVITVQGGVKVATLSTTKRHLSEENVSAAMLKVKTYVGDNLREYLGRLLACAVPPAGGKRARSTSEDAARDLATRYTDASPMLGEHEAITNAQASGTSCVVDSQSPTERNGKRQRPSTDGRSPENAKSGVQHELMNTTTKPEVHPDQSKEATEETEQSANVGKEGYIDVGNTSTPVPVSAHPLSEADEVKTQSGPSILKEENSHLVHHDSGDDGHVPTHTPERMDHQPETADRDHLPAIEKCTRHPQGKDEGLASGGENVEKTVSSLPLPEAAALENLETGASRPVESCDTPPDSDCSAATSHPSSPSLAGDSSGEGGTARACSPVVTSFHAGKDSKAAHVREGCHKDVLITECAHSRSTATQQERSSGKNNQVMDETMHHVTVPPSEGAPPSAAAAADTKPNAVHTVTESADGTTSAATRAESLSEHVRAFQLARFAECQRRELQQEKRRCREELAPLEAQLEALKKKLRKRMKDVMERQHEELQRFHVALLSRTES